MAGTLCVLAIATLGLASGATRYTAEGIVLGPDGETLNGAQVSLYVVDHTRGFDRDGIRAHKQLTTSANGKYAFAIEVEAEYRYGLIAAQKAGLAWNCRRWSLLADLRADIRLARPAELAGLVIDERGQPVAGAKVSLQALRCDHLRSYEIPQALTQTLFTTQTNARGRFRFTTLSADWRTDFLIEATGYGTVRSQDLLDYPYAVYGPGTSDIQFTLKPEAQIQGTIVRAADSEPLEGIAVNVGRTETGAAYGFESTISDRAGAFSFRGIPAGNLWVGVATSHAPDAGWVGWPIPIRAKAGETTEGVKLELTRGGIFEAEVVDPAGTSVEGAGLTVFTREGNRLAQGRTDAAGLCRIRLPPGAYKLVEVGKSGFHTHDPFVFFDIEAGQTVYREVTLKKAPRVEGIVVDADGRPVCDVRVVLMPSPTSAAYTDQRGRFAMVWDKWLDDDSEPRGRQFELIALDVKGNRAGSVKLKEATGAIRLVLRPAVRITGTVVGSEGKPLEHALVSSWLKGQTWGMSLRPNKLIFTDRLGRFSIFPVLPERTCELSVRAPNYDTRKKELQTPADTTQPLETGIIKLTPIPVTSKAN
ncbi:MAG: carboxypeptidase regulatory-like domain-containing protein [Sedimentisphaerales bacterium]|nr:carboxypeptidase regulatory-like domain-containing protein [Sedimentisphaerales bacterium]